MEQALLGAVLRSRGAKDHLLAELSERDFSDHRCRWFFKAMAAARLLGPVDYATAGAALIRQGAPEELARSIPELAIDVSPAQAEIYSERVREASVRRRLVAISPAAIAAEHESAADAIAALRSELDELDALRPRRGVIPAFDIARDAIERLGAAQEQQRAGGGMRGLATGIYRLDRCLSGLRRGGLYVLAARPGAGKTAFGLNVAVHAAQRLRLNVLFFSLEMSAAEVGDRIVSSEARISTETLAGGALKTEEWQAIGVTLSRFGETGFFLDERSGTRIDDMVSTARRLHAESPLSLVVIDYIQLVRGSGRRREGSREQEVAEVSRGSKGMAKALGCPVLGLAQLNREVEHREDKRPRLADLRESGALEADADAVIAIHRPYAYDASADPHAAELHVLKHRHGRTGVASVRWAPELVRFDNAQGDS